MVAHGKSGSRKMPEYVKLAMHTDETGHEKTALAGTQSLDGWWTHDKRVTHGVKSEDKQLLNDPQSRGQVATLTRGENRRVECGKMIS